MHFGTAMTQVSHAIAVEGELFLLFPGLTVNLKQLPTVVFLYAHLFVPDAISSTLSIVK